MSSLKAAILRRLNTDLSVETLKRPILGTGHVLVKLLYSGVCRSQLMEVRGGRGEDSWLPHLLGHEGSGVVIEIGEGVTKVSPGDEVILGWVKGEGLEAFGAVYKTLTGEKINSGRVTTFSNYTVVSESRVYKKPKNLSFESAVLFGCALPTGAGMVFNELKPDPKDVVVVLGLGGIGLSALMALIALGVDNVVAIDRAQDKLDLAAEIGAKHLVNSSKENVTESLASLYPQGINSCIECAGSVKTIELGFQLIKKNGRLIFASHPPEGQLIKLAPHDLIIGKKISGSWGGASTPDSDIPKMYDSIHNIENILHRMLSRIYLLEQINDALDDLESGSVFRPLIRMTHDE